MPGGTSQTRSNAAIRMLAGCALVLGLLPGCAFDIVHVRQIPTTLSIDPLGRTAFTLDRPVDLMLDTYFRRTLRAGTRWTYVGTTPHGDVFRTDDQVLTVEASNVHEAYLVVRGSTVQGFYLPVEKSFSPLGRQVELPMTPSSGSLFNLRSRPTTGIV